MEHFIVPGLEVVVCDVKDTQRGGSTARTPPAAVFGIRYACMRFTLVSCRAGANQCL